jgi:hypothetical protein
VAGAAGLAAAAAGLGEQEVGSGFG